VKFEWDPKSFNMTPTGALPETGAGSKNQQSWYADSKSGRTIAGSGWDEIRGNVETVGTTAKEKINEVTFDPYPTSASFIHLETAEANDEFVFDIKSSLYGYKTAVKLD